MELTTKSLKPYKGGQLEVQNPTEGYLYRGEIAAAKVEDGTFKVRFSWLAKGEGFPPLPKRWVKDDRRDYEATLEAYSVSDTGNGRICLLSPTLGEVVVLYPKGVSRLNPSMFGADLSKQ